MPDVVAGLPGVSAPGGFASADSRFAEVVEDLRTAGMAMNAAISKTRVLVDEPIRDVEVRRALHHALHRLNPLAPIVTEQYERLGAL